MTMHGYSNLPHEWESIDKEVKQTARQEPEQHNQ
jgi:hypothetical protein